MTRRAVSPATVTARRYAPGMSDETCVVKLATAALAGLLLAGCAASAHVAAAGPGTPPRSPVAPTVSASPATLLHGTCRLGFDNETSNSLDPLTAANSAEDGADQVRFRITSGPPTTLVGFETETTYHGQVINEHVINDTTDAGAESSPFDLPDFLVPGETYTALINLVTLSNDVNVSMQVYLHSRCSVVKWFRA